MEIKIKKIDSQKQKDQAVGDKKVIKRKRPTSKPKKIIPTQSEPKEIEDTHVTETLDDIDNMIELAEIDEKPEIISSPAINISELEWTYNMRDKSAWFYLILFALSAGFIYFSYKYNNWMLALIVILGFVMIAQKNAKIENFRVDKDGVYIQDQKIEWSNVLSCGIEILNGSTLLLAITPNAMLHTKIYIPFEKKQEREVLFLINKYSKFVNIKGSTFDQIVKWVIF